MFVSTETPNLARRRRPQRLSCSAIPVGIRAAGSFPFNRSPKETDAPDSCDLCVLLDLGPRARPPASQQQPQALPRWSAAVVGVSATMAGAHYCCWLGSGGQQLLLLLLLRHCCVGSHVWARCLFDRMCCSFMPSCQE